MRPLFLAALVVLPAGLLACSSESDVKVSVTGTSDACTAAQPSIASGKITFEFHNEASDINELYVLKPDGSIAGEIENVPTGQKRNLTVTLSAGDHTLTCKPGMKGDGVSSRLTVT